MCVCVCIYRGVCVCVCVRARGCRCVYKRVYVCVRRCMCVYIISAEGYYVQNMKTNVACAL